MYRGPPYFAFAQTVFVSSVTLMAFFGIGAARPAAVLAGDVNRLSAVVKRDAEAVVAKFMGRFAGCRAFNRCGIVGYAYIVHSCAWRVVGAVGCGHAPVGCFAECNGGIDIGAADYSFGSGILERLIPQRPFGVLVGGSSIA